MFDGCERKWILHWFTLPLDHELVSPLSWKGNLHVFPQVFHLFLYIHREKQANGRVLKHSKNDIHAQELRKGERLKWVTTDRTSIKLWFCNRRGWPSNDEKATVDASAWMFNVSFLLSINDSNGYKNIFKLV